MTIQERRRLLGLAATLSAAVLTSPARAQAPAAAPAAAPAPLPPPDARAMLEQFEKSGRGFDMRPGVKAATTVYVVFDPQCPWCAKFWDSAKPIAEASDESFTIAMALLPSGGSMRRKACGRMTFRIVGR